ncbi:hypothetical protein V8F20_009312, partial [Naviculisporaceae sp. PSN 640]
IDMVDSYYNDLVVVLEILEDYIYNFRAMFIKLYKYNISIGLKKSFIGFLNVIVFNKFVDFFKIIIIKERLVVIEKIKFF